MTSDDSGPGLLFDKPLRRTGERRIEALANNALLKLLQLALTGVALPAIGYGITAVIGRMDTLERQFIAQDKSDATRELRLLSLEKTVSETFASNQALRDRVLALEFETRMQKSTKGTP